jgi:predicted esterase
MEFGLRLNFPLGGLIPIAGFIKNPEKLRNDMTAESTKTPVLLLHGTEDRIVTPDGSKTAYEFLVRQGNPVRLEWYSSGHKIPVKAGALIKKFIQG